MNRIIKSLLTVSAPIGYFFGMGLGKMVTLESALLSSPEGRSFNCIFQMPFKDGMRMILSTKQIMNKGGCFMMSIILLGITTMMTLILQAGLSNKTI